MNTKFNKVSVKVNDGYVYAFREWCESECEGEFTHVDANIFAMLFPLESEYEENEKEVIEYLAKHHWYLGTHYCINK